MLAHGLLAAALPRFRHCGTFICRATTATATTAASALVPALWAHSLLLTLAINRNCHGVGGAVALSPCLAALSSLHVFDMCANHIGRGRSGCTQPQLVLAGIADDPEA
jgi:hypothetical protein